MSGTRLLAVGSAAIYRLDAVYPQDWSAMDSWIKAQNDWIFGWITYDAKNGIEKLETRHPNLLEFPQVLLIVPQNVIRWKNGEREVLKGEWREEFHSIINEVSTDAHISVDMRARVEREAYIEAIHSLQRHIHYGNIYEVNYCQEYFAEVKLPDPLSLWKKLRTYTHAPFSAYVKHADLHVMCASPERYIKKSGSKIISQPIKGTIKRGMSEEEDVALKYRLVNSKKERSENVMIVDLVRNDLSKFAVKGSVSVEELCSVHTFQTVHHLISTISAEVKPGVSFSEVIRDTFPMGSMTGAPKIRAMELIDEIELSARGLYSGTLGYITPEGDFDFNVVIRSMLYNDTKSYLSYSVGGAITALSDPNEEYEECQVKANALMLALK